MIWAIAAIIGILWLAVFTATFVWLSLGDDS